MNGQSTASSTLAGRYHFLLRKLHSLCGIIPIGGFVVFHLAVNAQSLAGGSTAEHAEGFQKAVDLIHSLPLLRAWEWGLIFLPLGFHAVYGLIITLSARPNVLRYPYLANWRYLLQRVSGVVILLFLIYHLGTLWAGYLTPFDEHDAYASTAAALQKWSWVWLIYAAAILAVAFHLGNGIWSLLISWGITISRRSQHRCGIAATAIALVLLALGAAALYGFKTGDANYHIRNHNVPGPVVADRTDTDCRPSAETTAANDVRSATQPQQTTIQVQRTTRGLR